MVIDIREVRPHDKAEWLQLWEGYTHFYGSPQPEEVTECTWQRMLDVNSPVLGRVAVVNDTVVGFAICILHEGTWVTTPICYLEDLFVDPAFRGQGIARTLIKSLQTEGADQGWSRLYWHTRRDNPARHLALAVELGDGHRPQPLREAVCVFEVFPCTVSGADDDDPYRRGTE